MTNTINCTEGYFESTDGKVYYLNYSSDEADGTPIIMIHGGPGFTHHYLEPLYTLANERPVILYDQLGCGKSDRPADMSYCRVDYFVSELTDLINHLGYDTVSLLGHSWGSSIASEYAIANSNVSHLILASPFMSAPLWNKDAEKYKNALPREYGQALRTYDKSSEVFAKAFDEYYRRHVYGRAGTDRSITLATEEASAEVYHTMWGQDEIRIEGVLKDYDCCDRLHNITAKTLFICGEFDTGGPDSCRTMSKLVPNSTVKVIKDCAHFPHLEVKVEYTKYLRDFLSDRSAEKRSFFQTLSHMMSAAR